MESSEREPSYYEVALTHRQLMVGLVVALTTVVVAFFAGVWIGRGGGSPAPKGKAAEAAEAVAASQPEQLTFFGDKVAAPRPATKPTPIAPKPATSPSATSGAPAAAPAETEAEALRKTLEEEMAANRVDEGGTGTAPAAVLPGTRVARESAATKPPAPATSTAKAPAPSGSTAKAVSPASASTTKAGTAPATSTPSPAASGTPIWIQVYSSTNRERADEISARLKKGGFAVKTLEPAKASGPYRVRVGPYTDRAKADRAASRLRREFKLDTWVTDSP